MQIDHISTQVSNWFKPWGPDSEVVVSSRIRLARNLADHRFVSRCSIEEKQEILDKLLDAVSKVDIAGKLFPVNMTHASNMLKDLLVERHLISRALAKTSGPCAAIISEDELFTTMINEEDHLRIQYILPGLQLDNCWKLINSFDDRIEQKVQYAFDPRLGYLTACPTNVGTGLRASVMLHLPGLKMTSQIEKMMRAAKDMNLAVRGLFGEGTEALGDFYQISNQVTLGQSEEEIINGLSRVIVPKIIEYELSARDHLTSQQEHMLNDKIYRAKGILKSAYMISSHETLFLLSQLRLGINLKKIDDISIDTVNELFMLTQPAHLQRNAGSALTADQRDRLRAEIIRKKLLA